MYTLYRRHELPTETSKGCPHRLKGVRHFKCNCPIWMDGPDERGKRQRRSLKTRSWTHAQVRVSDLEAGVAPPPPPQKSPLVHDAVESYLDDCRARRLQPSTIESYKNSVNHLAGFFPNTRVERVDLVQLTAYRSARGGSANNAGKEVHAMRAFFRFCLDRKWIAENPARRLKPPKSTSVPTMPFTQAEIDAMVAACDRIDNPNPTGVERARLRARALLLLLLYSGLRISDAVKLERSCVNLDTGQIAIRVMKTGVPLYIRVPRVATEALRALALETPYFFWSGRSKLTTAKATARRTIDCVLRIAGVTNGHPHRFRDTFSVRLLQNGTDLRTVQLLLGHTSIKTTEKHYAPFVASMQRGLDDAVSTLQFVPSTPDTPPPVVAKQANVVLRFPRAKRA